VRLESPLVSACGSFSRPYPLWTGLFQKWDMFAPDPSKLNCYVGAQIAFRDGRTALWNFPRMENLGIVEKYFQERYRKYANDNLRLDSDAPAWPDAARYIARLHCSAVNPPVRYRSIVPPPTATGVYTPGPWPLRLLPLFRCFRRPAMSPRSLTRAWNEFFFTPQPPQPVAVFRIFYGLLIIADLVLLRADWQTWFGPRALVTRQTWALLASSLMLAAGFLTRANSIATWILPSIHEPNLLVTNSGDTVLRATGFFLMFAPAGAAYSVDRWLSPQARQGRAGGRRAVLGHSGDSDRSLAGLPDHLLE
jgi:hypothetical protein